MIDLQLGELPLLPTTTVGSHGIPGWLHLAREEISRGTLGTTDVREIYDQAIALAIRDQERAGLDVVSDGEMRRLHFTQGFYPCFNGLRSLGSARRLGSPGYDQVPAYEVVDEIAAPNGLGLVDEFRFAHREAERPLKIACPGPLTFTLAVARFGPYHERIELAYRFAELINAELRALEAAGAHFLQLDEPGFSFFSETRGDVSETVSAATLADLYNRAVEGIHGQLALHVCFGNFHNRPRTSRSYRSLFPALLEARADLFLLEFANREFAEIELWKELSVDRAIGVGVVDVKSYYPETSDEVAARIRRVLRYVSPEKLWVIPDCGFNHTPHHACVAKLRAMVEGVRVVRRELGEV